MVEQVSRWIQVAAFSDIPPGDAKAVKLDDGRSIALFNVGGRIFATDNQCPHMGYPLTRGTIREGILTCDWHGRSFDLEGGGCFNYECDDLQIFLSTFAANRSGFRPAMTDTGGAMNISGCCGKVC
jgi:nitrite reductase/ring-hydroxylating ferredoxin subunit